MRHPPSRRHMAQYRQRGQQALKALSDLRTAEAKANAEREGHENP